MEEEQFCLIHWFSQVEISETVGIKMGETSFKNNEQPYDPAIPLLGIYPKELKTYVHTKICTKMFIAALFIIVKT